MRFGGRRKPAPRRRPTPLHGTVSRRRLVSWRPWNDPRSPFARRRPTTPKRVAFYRKKGFVPTGEIGKAKGMQTIRMERRGTL